MITRENGSEYERAGNPRGTSDTQREPAIDENAMVIVKVVVEDEKYSSGDSVQYFLSVPEGRRQELADIIKLLGETI